MKFKNLIFQLILEILLQQQSLNQIRDCLTGHNQIWHYVFIKKYQSILINFKIEVFQFYD